MKSNSIKAAFLSLRILHYPTRLSFHPIASKTSIQKASGNKKSETIPFVLIGQLGKHMESISDNEIRMADISGDDILSYVYEVIGETDSLIPCRCMMVECSDSEKVQSFYTRNGFKFLQQDGKLFQFFKVIHS